MEFKEEQEEKCTVFNQCDVVMSCVGCQKEHSENVNTFIAIFFLVIIDINEEHLQKAPFLIVVAVSGIVIEDNEVQLEKA